MKICVVTSIGGHLYQLYQLQRCWNRYLSFWVTFDSADVKSLLKHEKIYFAHYPESRSVFNAFKNFLLAWRIFRKEKPSIVISCGAGIAPPFFIVARLLRIHTIYLEPIDFIQRPSLTGVMSQYLVDLFLVQHPSQKRFFRRKVHYWGSTFDL